MSLTVFINYRRDRFHQTYFLILEVVYGIVILQEEITHYPLSLTGETNIIWIHQKSALVILPLHEGTWWKGHFLVADLRHQRLQVVESFFGTFTVVEVEATVVLLLAVDTVVVSKLELDHLDVFLWNHGVAKTCIEHNLS